MRKRQVQGSLTVETTFILPLFIFVIVGFLYFFQVLTMQVKIQENLTEVAQQASRYGYLYDYLVTCNHKEESGQAKEQGVKQEVTNILSGLVEGTFYKMRFKQLMEDEGGLGAIDGGLDNIHFLGSSFMEEDGIITVVANYKIKIPVPFFSQVSFPVTQQVKTRGFIGLAMKPESGSEDGEEKSDDEYVYVTRTGTKYHKSKGCTYLSPKVKCVTMHSIKEKRNSSGGIYYPCESCAKGNSKQSSCYITTYGNRYHTDRLCKKIEHDITSIKLSEVGSRTPCSKCYSK